MSPPVEHVKLFGSVRPDFPDADWPAERPVANATIGERKLHARRVQAQILLADAHARALPKLIREAGTGTLFEPQRLETKAVFPRRLLESLAGRCFRTKETKRVPMLEREWHLVHRRQLRCAAVIPDEPREDLRAAAQLAVVKRLQLAHEPCFEE